MDKVELEFEWHMNSPQAKAEAAEVKKAVTGIGDTAEQQQERVRQNVKKTTTIFSDSKAEVEAYRKSVDSSGTVAKSGIEQLIKEISKDFKAGKIDAQAYREEMERLNALLSQQPSPAPHRASSPSYRNDYKEVFSDADSSFDLLDKNTQSSILSLSALKNELTAVKGAGEQLSKAFESGEISSSKFEKEQAKLLAREKEVHEGLKNVAADLNRNSQASATLTTELQHTKNAMAQLASEGKKNGKEYQELEKRASELKLHINDVNKSVQTLGSTTPTLDTLAAGVGGIAGAFTAGQGAVALFGGENTNLEKTIAKVTASMAVLQGIQAISASVTKLSAVASLYLRSARTSETVATTAATGATVANSVAVAANTSLIGGAIAATRAWTAALIANPIGLIATAITLAVTALIQYVSTTDDAEASTERLNNQLELQTSLLEDNISAIEQGTDYAIALAEKRGAKESEMQQIRNDGLKKQRKELLEEKKNLSDSIDANDQAFADGTKSTEQYYKDLAALKSRYKANGTAVVNNQAKIDLGGIKTEVAFSKEAQAAEKERLRFEKESIASSKRKADAIQAAIDRRDGLLKRINRIEDEYSRKSQTRDEQEVQAVRDKFSEIRTEIEKFNGDPDNKGYKITVGGLNKLENSAVSDVTYRQNTSRFSESLEEQKKLYQDYEKFRDDFGEQKAKERYKRQIDTEKTYLQVVEAELGKLLEKDPTEMSGTEKERLEAFTKMQNEAQEAENKRQDETLKEFQAYADQRLVIQETYLRQVEAFRKTGNEKEAQEALDRGNKELTAIDEVNMKKWGSYKNLFEFIGTRTKGQTLEAIAWFEKELKSAKLTNDARAEGLKILEDLKKGVKTGSGKELDRLANDLARVASEFSSINNDIAQIAGMLVNATRAYIEIKKDIDVIKKPKASTIDKISAGLGIAGAAISIASSIFGYFKGLKQAKEEAKKAVDEFYQKAKQGELEYQNLMRQRERDDIARGKSSYKAIVDQLDLIKKQEPAIREAYERIFQALQGQSFASGKGSQHGTWFRKAKTWDIMSSLFGSNFDDLEQLDLQGKLSGQSKTDFDSLKQLREELRQAGIDAEELKSQLAELLTGTSASGLSDGLTQLFQNGKFAAQDFGDSFEEIMRNAFINSFKYKYLEDAMQPIHEELASLLQGGTPDQAAIEALRKKYQDVADAAAGQWKTLEQVTGVNLSTGQSSNTNSMAGAIEGITADQADLLAGQFGGLRLGQLEGNVIARNNGSTAMEQLGQLRSSALTLVLIEENTRRSALAVETYLPILKSIDTKLSNNSNAAAAAGRG